MARSIQTVVSSGSLVILGVTLDYYERDDITVYFDDEAQLTGWGWVGTTDKTIVFDPAVPAGVTVKLQRRTDVDRMKHSFTSGAQFKNTNVDTNFLQLLHAVQEIKESGVPPSAVGGLDMVNEKITSLAPGTAGSDAVNKAQLDTAIAGVVAGSGSVTSATNLGTGLGVFANRVGDNLNLRSLVPGTNVTLVSDANSITINASVDSSGESNTASNVGTGAGVFKAKTGVDLALKSLRAGANVTITPGADDILISATAGPGTAPFKSLTEFGAVGDGTTDNTTAFASAAAYFYSTGRTVYIPEGVYLTAPFVINHNPAQAGDTVGFFFGSSPDRTIIRRLGTGAGTFITLGAPSNTAYISNVWASNITIDGGAISNGPALEMHRIVRTKFDCVRVRGGSTACVIREAINLAFHSCTFADSGTGMLITHHASSADASPNNINIYGGFVGDNTVCGINYDYGRMLNLNGVQIEGNGTTKGAAGQGGIIVGSNVGGSASSGYPNGIIVDACWFESNRGVADVLLQSGLNTIRGCVFWSQESQVTNSMRVTGGKYSLTTCKFAFAFTAGVPALFEGALVQAGNFIANCTITNLSWDPVKTVLVTSGVYGSTVTANSAIYARGLNVAPVWSALSGTTINKPVILCGGDTSSATPTIPFGRTMANNNTVVIVQPIDVQQANTVYSPLLTGVTTTGFTISKDVISPTVKSVSNYAVYWIAIGEEA